MAIRRMTLFLVGLSILAGEAVSAKQVTVASDSVQADSLAFVVEIGSRLYPDWKEDQHLQLDELFYLGDSEYTAKIKRFVPDFRIIDGKIVNLSDELKNPAAQVFVYHDSTAVDSTWAFLNFPPHFSPKAFFTFKLKEVQGFKAREQEED